jgi:hypothetical protein
VKNLNRFMKNMHYFLWNYFLVINPKIPLSLALSRKGRGKRWEVFFVPSPLMVASGDSSALRRTRRGEPRRGGN